MNNLINYKSSLSSPPKLLTKEELSRIQVNPELDSYTSIFKYNESHKKIVESTGSVAGIKDVTTDTLVWDFDSKDLEKCRADVVELANRLVDRYEVDPSDIDCYFSSNKGFHVVLFLNNHITPEQFKAATSNLAKDLSTFDTVVSDPARIIRMPNTKNPKSGLYKVQLDIGEIANNTIEEIKERAKSPTRILNSRSVTLPEDLFKVPEKKPTLTTVKDYSEFDYSNPPKGWKKYKYALAQGWFQSGERHQALMVIAATCRGLGYDKGKTYYICKDSLKKQAERTGEPEFDKSELFENIIEKSVFGPNWDGGQYSPENNPWLAKYCERMHIDIKEKDVEDCMPMEDLIFTFQDYSTNFDQNLIKTGIQELDENIIYSTSTLNGVLGQPGAGKTSWVMSFLKSASLNNIPSMFLSCDMGPPLVYAKMVQSATGCDFKTALNIYKTNKAESDKISQIIKNDYKSVAFNFKSGITVDQIRSIIEKQTESTGVAPKLLAIDYLECLGGPYSDPTANAGYIANQLKDLATELKLCIVLLLQTQKHSTPDISDPLLSMKQIKGASIIEQACSTVLTLWREGYNPNYINDDKYISFAVVKNRFGPQWRGDFFWDPVRGAIRSLTDEEWESFDEFKKRKKQEKEASKSSEGSWT